MPKSIAISGFLKEKMGDMADPVAVRPMVVFTYSPKGPRAPGLTGRLLAGMLAGCTDVFVSSGLPVTEGSFSQAFSPGFGALAPGPGVYRKRPLPRAAATLLRDSQHHEYQESGQAAADPPHRP
ncbi:hypothetical protein WBP07_24495 [Novosphingobium sp. BL-8A]